MPSPTLQPTICPACGRSGDEHDEAETKRCRGALLRGMRPLVASRPTAA